jgi:hypothetical protein
MTAQKEKPNNQPIFLPSSIVHVLTLFSALPGGALPPALPL